MIINEQIDSLFKKCCSEYDGRYNLSKPFRVGDYIYATDGRVCIRAKTDASVDAVGKHPKVTSLGWDSDRDAGFTMPDMGKQPEVPTCENCMGTGRCICDDCSCEHDCGDCDGTGFGLVDWRAVKIPVGDAPVYVSEKFARMFMDGIWYPSAPRDPVTVELGPCEALVMPICAESVKLAGFRAIEVQPKPNS